MCLKASQISVCEMLCLKSVLVIFQVNGTWFNILLPNAITLNVTQSMLIRLINRK